MPIDESIRTIFVKKPHLSTSIHHSDHVKYPSYSCSYCSKCFSSPSHLTRHTLIHTGEKPCLCSECGQQFSQISSLERHQRTKHRHDRQNTTSSHTFYQCHLCYEYFSLKHNLKMHERKLHRSPTNFFCQLCSAYFTCNSALQKHRNFRHRTSTTPLSDDDRMPSNERHIRCSNHLSNSRPLQRVSRPAMRLIVVLVESTNMIQGHRM
jgi:hypothetical protein